MRGRQPSHAEAPKDRTTSHWQSLPEQFANRALQRLGFAKITMCEGGKVAEVVRKQPVMKYLLLAQGFDAIWPQSGVKVTFR
jgi:hypothetical protein